VAEESEKKGPLTFSEKFKNVCLGIAALSALILGTFNMFKGEPVAEKTWTTLRTQVNDISGVVNKLTRRVVFLQAHESGRMAAEVQLRLEALQKENDALRAAQAARTPSTAPAPSPAPKAGTEQKCSAGHLLAGGRCQRVPLAVAKRVKEDEAELRRRLEEEKRRGIELEKRKQQLMQQVQQKPPPAPDSIRALPKKLEDASKSGPALDSL